MTNEERQQLRDEIDIAIEAIILVRKLVYSKTPDDLASLYNLSSHLNNLIFTLAKDTSNEL